MTDPVKILLPALLLLAAGANISLAQDSTTTAERARRAFDTGEAQPGASSTAEQGEAEAAAREAAQKLGVELLSVRLLEARGGQLVAARVMAPGGDSNAAFLVQTLVLDPESGAVLGVFPGDEDEVLTLPQLLESTPQAADERAAGGAE